MKKSSMMLLAAAALAASAGTARAEEVPIARGELSAAIVVDGRPMFVRVQSAHYGMSPFAALGDTLRAAVLAAQIAAVLDRADITTTGMRCYALNSGEEVPCQDSEPLLNANYHEGRVVDIDAQNAPALHEQQSRSALRRNMFDTQDAAHQRWPLVSTTIGGANNIMTTTERAYCTNVWRDTVPCMAAAKFRPHPSHHISTVATGGTAQ